MSFLSELKRRNVFRVAVAYVALAWLMAQVAELLLEAFGAPGWVLKTLIALFLIGFPFALFFAWAYELTPQGLRREAELPENPALAAQAARRLDRIIILLLVLALGAFAWDRFGAPRPDAPADPAAEPELQAETLPEPVTPASPEPSPELSAGVPERSIAVLPFANMSQDPDNDFFSYGISEEVLNLLARLPGLHVTSRSSSFQFKGEDVHIPTVAEQLGVAHVLEGSVRKSGNQVRITAQLIDADVDRHLWSDTWDRELTDIFAIQDEIAAAVVDALQETLLGGIEVEDLTVSQRTDSRAYELFLRGRYLTWERTPDALHEAESLFSQAIEIDPRYAPAHAGLGLALFFQTNVAPIDGTLAFKRAEAAISKALELDPDSWEAYEALGLVRSDQGRFAEGRSAFKKAIELNPNDARAWYWLSNQYGNSDPVRSLELAQKAYYINPLARIVVAGLGWRHRPLGHYAEALEQARKYHELFPDSNWAYRSAADVYECQGRLDLALKSSHRAYRAEPRVGYGFMLAPSLYLQMGENELARAWLDEIEKVSPLWGDLAFHHIELGAVSGDTGRAVETVRAYMERSESFLFQAALAQALAVHGDFAAARAAIEQALPGLTREPPQWDPEWWHLVRVYAMTLKRLGSADRAAGLLDSLRTLIEAQIEAGVECGQEGDRYESLAMVYGLQGHSAMGLEALRKAVQRGGALCLYCLNRYPEYAELREAPGFDELVAQQQAKLDAQRQNLAAEGMLLTPEEVLALESIDFDPLAETSSRP